MYQINGITKRNHNYTLLYNTYFVKSIILNIKMIMITPFTTMQKNAIVFLNNFGVGHESLRTLKRLFLKVMGTAPKQYRDSFRQ